MYTTIKFLTVFSIAGSIAAASAETVTVPQLAPFTSVVLNGLGIVRIQKGPQSVTLKGNETSLNAFETSVKNGSLVMGFGRTVCLHPFRKYAPVEIDITMPELTGITINGNGIIKTGGFDFGPLAVILNGNAVLETAGTTPSLDLNCTGNATFSGFPLSARNVTAKLTGNVNAEISAAEKLTASVTGAGRIVYRGTPEVVQKITGAGEIVRDGSN